MDRIDALLMDTMLNLLLSLSQEVEDHLQVHSSGFSENTKQSIAALERAIRIANM